MSHLQIVFLVNSLEKEKMAKHKRFFFFWTHMFQKKQFCLTAITIKKDSERQNEMMYLKCSPLRHTP